MFWKQRMMTSRFAVTLGLFLVGGLHTMMFAIFQIPGNFLLGHEPEYLLFYCKLVLYLCAITVSLNHQFICKRFGLRKALYFGLILNLFGILILWTRQNMHGHYWLIFLDMICFGLALTSVINPLITYIVLEFPKKVGAGITALFATFNIGVMLAPIALDTFRSFLRGIALYPILVLMLLFSIWFVHAFFFDPPYPKHLEHLRKGSKIWKELHYRLALFMIAIIAYGLTENTFGLWGLVEMRDLFGTAIANETISVFWLFMVIGQLLLLIPLYFFPAKKIFYLLLLIVISALYRFPHHKSLEAFIADLALAGFGCSAIFPILISMMEKEILPFAKGREILPYIETATSVMIAGYFIGVGSIDLWVVKMGSEPWRPYYFYLAAAFTATTAAVGVFLNLTAPANPPGK